MLQIRKTSENNKILASLVADSWENTRLPLSQLSIKVVCLNKFKIYLRSFTFCVYMIFIEALDIFYILEHYFHV